MRNSAIWLIIIIGLLCLVLGTPALIGQTGNGTIQGVVKDSTGAVIPSATVRITHVETARSYELTSNEIGFFVLPSVVIGNYRITVGASGMQTWEGQLVLQVGQIAVVRPVLNVGATTTEITVAGDVTSLLTQETPTLGATMERNRIEQLPLNGRFFSSLVDVTTPGMEGLKPKAASINKGINLAGA